MSVGSKCLGSSERGSRSEKLFNKTGRTLPLAVGALLFLAALVLYLKTLAPTVLYYDLPELRDSAVLQTRAYMLGIPDYTGYPTYILLAHLFTYLPFGDAAWRVNFASAVYASGTVALVFASALVLTRKVSASVAGAGAFGVGPLFWSQAVVAEVYTLNALFVAASVLTFLFWHRSRRDRYLLLGCLLMGLSLTNHITSGLVLPGALLLVALTDWRKFLDFRLVLKGAGLFVVGLSPYLYLPIRASIDYLPDGFVWGQPRVREYPPDTLYGFYNLVSGGQWKERMWAFAPSELPGRVYLYLDYLCGGQGQFGVWMVLVGVAGGLYLAYRRPRQAAFLGFLYFGWLFHALEYDIEDIEYYFLPTYLVLCLLMSVGFSGGLDAVRRYLPDGPVSRGVAGVVSVAIVALPLVGVGETYRTSDMSGDYRGREITNTVASETVRGATILHHRSPLDYMILVEDRRPDLKLIPYLEERNPYGVGKGILEARNAPTYILFPGRTSTPYYPGVEQTRLLYNERGYDLAPVNADLFLYRVVRKDST